MQVKKFEAPTIQEALDTIKRELGPEAIILQTKKHKRGFGLLSRSSVEITAAVSERAIRKKMYVDSRLPADHRDSLSRLSAEKQAKMYNKYEDRVAHAASETRDNIQISSKTSVPSRRITATRYADIADDERSSAGVAALSHQSKLEEEIKRLKDALSEMRATHERDQNEVKAQIIKPNGAFLTSALENAFEQLVLNGVEKRYALDLIRKGGFQLGEKRSENLDDVLDQIATELMEGTEVVSFLDGVNPNKEEGDNNSPVVVALVGPTGVGKTTTLAKIASEAVLKRDLKVGLINVDCYKIAANDQLATYGKILKAPFRHVENKEQLDLALQDFKQFDLVLIDTSGRSQKDSEALQEMRDLLKLVPSLRMQLVLSVSTRDQELYDAGKRFGIFSPEGLIFSKLDEASLYGSIFNVSNKLKLPLTYFTTGQRVPEDIEIATRERVAALIMDL